jgi:hypothetical protein
MPTRSDQRAMCRAGGPVVVGHTGFVGASEQAIVDFIRSAYSNRPKPDLIVSVAVPRPHSCANIDGSSFPTRR